MKRLAISLFAAAALIAGCGSDDPTFFANNNFQPNNNNNNNNNPGVSYRQIEQLARPGINEALLFTNTFLNTYNAVSPQFVATALANPNSQEGQAAAPIFAQATAVLQALIDVGAPGGITTPGQAVAAFLPDVMRVDSSLAIPVGTSAYAFAANGNGSPVAGRKLTDDVIDITYGVLVGTGVSDQVPYYAPGGNTNNSIGHQRLNGQAADNGAATFPFLAPAN